MINLGQVCSKCFLQGTLPRLYRGLSPGYIKVAVQLEFPRPSADRTGTFHISSTAVYPFYLLLFVPTAGNTAQSMCLSASKRGRSHLTRTHCDDRRGPAVRGAEITLLSLQVVLFQRKVAFLSPREDTHFKLSIAINFTHNRDSTINGLKVNK